MKIAIDIDGTLSRSFERLTELLREQGYDVVYEDFVYDVGYPPVVDKETMWSTYEDNMSDLRRNYDVYSGAKAVIASLGNHEFIAITKRFASKDHPCEDTLHWIEKHGFPFSQVFFVGDKAKTCIEEGVDVLIDDHIPNALEVAGVGIPVLLHNQHYNTDFDHPLVTRFFHWLEVPTLLTRVKQ